MAGLNEVPTDELLSFQDYAPVHGSGFSNTTVSVNVTKNDEMPAILHDSSPEMATFDEKPATTSTLKSFWSIEYYQQLFDVDTKDVMDRIIASITPRRDSVLKSQIKSKPDLYGPVWISITLVFTIAISGNVADYLQHAHTQYHWKYNFHLVSYAATAIFLYISLVPFALWGLLKWSSEVSDLDGLEDGTTPSALELICVYGYSLFIYIPVSILWTIRLGWLQWALVITAAFISGSVLLMTLMPSLRLSRHKLTITCGIIACHLLLAAGFMLYFFHSPTVTNNPIVVPSVAPSVAPHHLLLTTPKSQN